MRQEMVIVLEHPESGVHQEFKISSKNVEELLHFFSVFSGKCRNQLPSWRFVELRPTRPHPNKFKLLLRLLPITHYLINPFDFVESVKNAVGSKYPPQLIEKIALLFEPLCMFDSMSGSYIIMPPALSVRENEGVLVVSREKEYLKHCRNIVKGNTRDKVVWFVLYHCPHSPAIIQKGNVLIEKRVRELGDNMKLVEVEVSEGENYIERFRDVIVDGTRHVDMSTRKLRFGKNGKILIDLKIPPEDAFKILRTELSRDVVKRDLNIVKLFNSCLVWPNTGKLCLHTRKIHVWPKGTGAVSLIVAELMHIADAEVQTKEQFVFSLVERVPHKIFRDNSAKELLRVYSQLQEFFTSREELVFSESVLPLSPDKIILVMKPVFSNQIVPIVVADAVLARATSTSVLSGTGEPIQRVQLEFILPWVNRRVVTNLQLDEFELLKSIWDKTSTRKIEENLHT
ncbi:hypothetical protein E3E30_02485 [Thermococcus sp. 9N3]|nr:hypothetical protein [Thermococcus sp. 9N3]